jgi:DNA polymerase-4
MRGIDSSPVLSAVQKKPIVNVDHMFGNDTNDTMNVNRALYGIVEKVGADLRQRGLAAGRVQLFLDYSDGKRIIRQARIHPASASDFRLFSVAKTVLKQAWTRRVRIRNLRLSCSRLTFPPPTQRTLFGGSEEGDRKKEPLVTVLDTIRNRFGHSAVRFAFTLS